MAQFAEQMLSIDWRIVFPARDETGLDGAWDFTIDYDSLAGLMRPEMSQGESAAEPTGAMPLFEAMQRQLGLKVETRKRPGRELVIDSMLASPVEN